MNFIDKNVSVEKAVIVLSKNGLSTITIIYVSVAENFKNYRDVSGDAEKKAKEYLSKFSKQYDKAKVDHISDYQKQFNRIQLDLGQPVQMTKPTGQRISEFANIEDPDLVTTYFQFGRYLLVSSSQPESQPSNLQGIWNPNSGQYPARHGIVNKLPILM